MTQKTRVHDRQLEAVWNVLERGAPVGHLNAPLPNGLSEEELLGCLFDIASFSALWRSSSRLWASRSAKETYGRRLQPRMVLVSGGRARTVAVFGFLEEMLGKAIFALTGMKEFDPDGDPDAFAEWIKTLEKTITDQLGGLIITYEKALADNDLTKNNDYAKLIAELKKAKDIRNVLCHCSWESRTIKEGPFQGS